MKYAVLGDREQIHIPSSSPDQAKSSEGRTADYDYLLPGTQRLQLLRQSAKEHIERLAGDLHMSEHNRSRC